MILGITGTNGAGKGTAVEYLVNEKGFTHYSVRVFLIEEIQKRGMAVDRSSMRTVANDLRTTHEPSYIIGLLYQRAVDAGLKNAVIESVRNSGEAEFLQSHGALLWAIDADRDIRYERIQKRASETDRITFDEFVVQEEREWHGAEGKADMDILTVMSMADHTFYSNLGKNELYLEVEEALQEVESKQ